MSTSTSHQKHQQQEHQNIHLQHFRELHLLIQKISAKLQKEVEIMQATKLQEFKQDLQKTKSQFNIMNETRKQKAIQKAVYLQKKQLEKLCAGFLEKSIQVNRMYESLRGKLTNMQTKEQQLDHYMEYLNKHIISAQKKNEGLKRQFQKIEKEFLNQKNRQNSPEKPKLMIFKQKKNIDNCRQVSSDLKQKNNKQLSNTKQWEERTRNRLKDRIQSTNYLISTLIFQKGSLEQIFEVELPSDQQDRLQMDSRKSLTFIQNMLTKQSVKKTSDNLLHQLLAQCMKPIFHQLQRIISQQFAQPDQTMKNSTAADKSTKNYSLKTAQQQAFLQIFNLHAIDGKITRDDLSDMFYRIGFSISQQNFNDICEKAFGNKDKISFQQFMQTFKVKQSNFDLVDIKNAFKLIAGDSDEKISVKQMEDLFEKNGIESSRIKQIMNVLSTYIDNQGMFNYKLFLSHLS